MCSAGKNIMNNPVFVMVAPNGARRSKSDHPALPVSRDELVTTAAQCHRAGAAAIHLHIRDDLGRHCLDVTRYAGVADAVSAALPDMAVQVTTESASIYNVDAQERVIGDLRPAYASVSIAEIVQDGEERAVGIVRRAFEAGTAVQFILYSGDDIRLLSRLRRRLFNTDREPSTLLVAGRYRVVDHATPDMVRVLYGTLSAEGLAGEGRWMVCAFGRGEMACLRAAMELGGHARVGFENAIVDSDGRPAVDNAQRVADVVAIAKALGRPLMTARSAPLILG